jgi:hypothetical protein
MGVSMARAESIMRKRSEKQVKVPKFEAEIKINEELVEKCVVYEGQTAEEVTEMVAKKHGLEAEAKKVVLEQLQKNFLSA